MTTPPEPVQCLSGYCRRPATHWHDGAPWCLNCAWTAIEEEGRRGFEPVPGNPREFARYYTDRDLDPHRKIRP